MAKRMKGIFSRLLILALFIGSFGSLLTDARADSSDQGAGASSGLVSPEIGTRTATGAEVTFNYQGDGSEQIVSVKGSFDKDWPENPMLKGANDVWSYSRHFDAGWYEYGIVADGDWKADPLNQIKNKTNPGLSVPGIEFKPQTEIGLGQTITVTSAVYYTGDRDTTIPPKLTMTKGLSGVKFDDITNELTVAQNAEEGTIKLAAQYEDWTVEREVKVTGQLLKSPVINSDGTVTFNVEKGNRTSVYLVGTMNSWNNSTAIPLDLIDGVFTLTTRLDAGPHEYKFIPNQGSWDGGFTDPLNPPSDGDNSKVIVPGIIITSDENAAIGGELELEAELMDEKGKGTRISPTWSLETPVAGVEIKGNILTVDSSAPVGKATVVATYETFKTITDVNLVTNLNAYTINFYRFDGTADKWNLWLYPISPDKGKSRSKNFKQTVDGYAQVTYYSPFKKTGVIPRFSTEGNEWADKDAERSIQIDTDNSVEVWIVEGITEVFYEKPDLEKLEAEKYRRVQLTYVKDDADFSGWSVWTWYTGFSNKGFSFADGNINGNKSSVIIPITTDVNKIGFKIRKSIGKEEWAVIDQNYDREITTGTEVLTKVIVESGKGPFRVLPGTSAPFLEDGNATFYYRDYRLFKSNEMDKIQEVKLKFNGIEYPMVYSKEDERFTFTLKGLQPGTFDYSYLVTIDGVTTEVLDPKNTVNDKSQITYKVLDVNIEAETKPNSISYNENALLHLNLSGIQEDEIRSIYADLTALGGKKETTIDEELMSLTLAVSDTVTTGNKQLPITVVDVYGNKHIQNASITVKTRQVVGSDDFDWDEARIYFMLTDRFFNGDTSNDDKNGENYDTNHLETYHGGDFKGVTEKIPYLKELGVNTIWITPIVDNIDFNVNSKFSQYGYHGYWAKDFTEIDEHLGELADLHNLLDTAHENGMKVMVDVVLNHTGYGMDDISGYAGKTNLPTPAERDVFNGMLREINEDPVIKNKIAGLPDFKTEDPAVREKVIKWQTDWIELARTAKGNTIDYFRVDTIKHVEHTTWMAFKNQLTEKYPEFKMIGENFGATLDNDGGYLRTGTMDSVLDFGFKGTATSFVNGRISDTEQALQSQNSRIDNASTLGQFLSSHDENGFVVNLLKEEERSKFKEGTLEAETLRNVQGQQKIAASLQITAKGQPVIYYGEEVGHSGLNADMDNGRMGENRYDFDWKRLDDPTYNHIYDHYKKMLNIRDKHSKTFSKGTRAQLGGSDATGYDIFARTYKGESIVVGINTKDTEQQATFTVSGYQNATFTDEYSGKTYTANSNGTVTVSLPSSLDGGTVVLTAPKPEPLSPDGGGGGSSYSTTPSSATPSPAPTPQVNPGTVEVAAKAGADGRKIAEVSLANVEKAIDSAAKGDKVVEIKVSGVNAGEATDVVIPGEAVAKAGDQNVGLRLVFPDITVNIPATGLPAKLNAHENIIFSKDVAATDAAEALKQGIKGKDSAYQPVGDIYIFGLSSVDASKQTAAIKLGAEVSVTLTLDDAVLKGIANKKKVGVYAVKEDGTVQYVGGKLKDNTITFTTDTLTRFVVMEYNKTFSDVKSGWSKDYIELLAAKHIASGVDSERFNPKGNVTRAEFAAFLGRALGLDQSAQAPSLSDIQDGAYYAGYVAALNKLGIITGYNDGTFRPNQTVTREQITVMLMRAYAHVSGSSLGQISGSEQASFNDLNTASGYAVDSIKAAKALGIINGLGENKFQPTATSTREQVAAMIILFLEKLDL
ncbi:Glycosidase [Fontibacillus panacisegetis]|uniref:Glycosidase n=1 Tax=Fontibacillus panacisegetis TaxID=670482 RepID=A0A1G7TKL4_9BACL|nr:alpha-amylase family glycosyl hydrolase [Fontibacillus panacisegetis]SDG35050.1 Glycosidase [Fontibacillus panacisegetis]